METRNIRLIRNVFRTPCMYQIGTYFLKLFLLNKITSPFLSIYTKIRRIFHIPS